VVASAEWKRLVSLSASGCSSKKIDPILFAPIVSLRIYTDPVELDSERIVTPRIQSWPFTSPGWSS
jgi:hypothetical protein